MSQTKLWSLLAGVVVVAMAVGGWFIGIAPERAKANRIGEEAATQRQANAGLETQIATLKALEPDLPRQQARLEEIEQKLPSNPEQPRLIRALDKAAENAGVLLGSVAAAPPVAVPAAVPAPASQASGDSTSASTDAESGASANAASPVTDNGLEQIVLTIVVYGDYSKILQYLHELESMDRALVVEGLSVAPGDPPQPEGAPTVDERDRWRTLSGTITARVFVAPPVAAVSAAPPNGQAKG
jgi:Tfp pilus assembly protein PilO